MKSDIFISYKPSCHLTLGSNLLIKNAMHSSFGCPKIKQFGAKCVSVFVPVMLQTVNAHMIVCLCIFILSTNLPPIFSQQVVAV